MKPVFIVFVHIEKAGGTTFHHILKQNYLSYVSLNNPVFWKKYDGIFDPVMLEKLLTKYPFIKGVGGHTLRPFLNYEDSVTNNEVKYLTFLRDPVNRYLSHFFYQKKMMKKNWTLESFCETQEFTNYQTKKIAGEENLELAKKILAERFDFVGIVEHFNLSLLLLNKQIPTLGNLFYKKRNVLKKEPDYTEFDDLSNSTKQLVWDNNDLDFQLYNYALQSVFKKNIDHYFKSEIDNLLEEFEILNKNNQINDLKKIYLVFYKQIFEKILIPIHY